MKRTYFVFAFGLSVVMSVIISLAWGCYNLVGEEPFVCLPLALPSFLFTWVADFVGIKYGGPIDWPLIIIGSFVIWMILGFLIKFIVDSFKKLR